MAKIFKESELHELKIDLQVISQAVFDLCYNDIVKQDENREIINKAEEAFKRSIKIILSGGVEVDA